MTVSIIIPARNAEPFIRRALESALRAGARVPGNYEIIAVDNGSTDRTREAIREFAARYPELVRAADCAIAGAPAARNHGVSLSSGEWLQFLDADDTMTERKIAHQLKLAGEADWVVGAYRNLRPDGSTESDVLPHPDLWRGLFFGFRTGCTHSNLLRRRTLLEVGGWDESLPSNQDPELHFRLLQAGVPYVIDGEINSYYHHHDTPDRVTASDEAGRYQRRVTMLAAANAYLIRTRPAYWAEQSPYFLGALLRAIRMLATYDLDSATQAYQAYFAAPNEWAIDRPYELVPRYSRLYPYLGFHRMEWLRLKLATLLPQSLKDRLKS